MRMLKDVYYPRDNFFSARKERKASWGWTSILSGRHILNLEGLWKIGDDAPICALRDPWVYTKVGVKVEPKPNGKVIPKLKVNALVNPIRHGMKV